MPTIICTNCGKPWMDTKHRACPTCHTPADGARTVEEPAGSAPESTSAHGTDRIAQRVSRVDTSSTAPPASAGAFGMTKDQADRIIDLLERRTKKKVEVTEPAVRASGVLRTLAVVVVIVGVVGLVLSLVAMAQVGFLYGLTVALGVVAYTALTWASLTVASVVSGYVANRST